MHIDDDVRRMSKKELQREVMRLRAGQVETENAATDVYNRGFTDGWNYAMEFLDEYHTPLVNAATDVNLFMGLALGISLAGVGKLPKEMLRELGNIFAYLINDAHMQDERFRQAMKDRIDLDVPTTFNFQPAYDTNQAITRYYSGKDKGESLIAELRASRITQLLLSIRRKVKDKVDETDAALDEIMISMLPTAPSAQDAGITLLRTLEENQADLGDLLSGVLKRLQNQPYGKMGTWLRKRAERARKRDTSL